MALLQANVSTAPLEDNKKTDIKENVDINIISDTALMPVIGPLGVSDGTEEYYSPDDTSIYVVHEGDTISQIADMFKVTPDTILSVNDLKKGEKLVKGDVLLILPFSGVEHTVVKGETLKGLSTKYKVDVDEIISNNIDININSKLAIGDKLIIPGASILSEPKATIGKKIAKGSSISDSLKQISGYFMYPLPKGPRIRKTQGMHDKYAIDIGAPTGTPIYASASGTVIFAKNGWNGAYGNSVFMKHPNGTETRYAHMSKLATSPGAHVNQGDLIGYVGSTGRSTGPHLHFEVRGARNPF